jgi:lysophospholipase L1-like esterase
MLVRGLGGQRREYLVYFPLYNGVESVEIGVAPESVVEPATPGRRPPIVFYGTSILQGGCAARPGMAYPALVSRRLDWPVINLGFSGNAKSEPEMAALIAELKAAAFVLDSLPNLNVEEVRGRVEPFVRTIRAAQTRTPILLVENVIYTDADYVAARRERCTQSNAVLRSIYEKLRNAGDRNVYYVPSKDLLGDDGEGTVDGTHPTDLGFLRMSQVIGQALQGILGPQR